MNIAKKLLLWMMGAAALPCIIIICWLFTFMSFDLLSVFKVIEIRGVELLIIILWGLVVIGLPQKDVNEMIS